MNGNWLLCDFHIHTDFSDGALPLREVIDLYGGKGFDVIGVSDHIAECGDYVESIEDRGFIGSAES